MSTGRIKHFIDGHRITLIAVLCLFGLCLIKASSRPDKKPVRHNDDKIYLIHADELLYDRYGSGMRSDAQIVRGGVIFETQGSRLKCDSAYFYQARNSVIAIGNVIYTSGDTLTMTCDSASYEGSSITPTLKAFSKGSHRVHYIKGDTLKVECVRATYSTSKDRAGEKKLEAREDVVFNNKGKTLETDNLNYLKNSLEEKAWFFEGGVMKDGKDSLSADWGVYYLPTKQAEFYYDVKMRDGKWDINTETLYYDGNTSKARIVGESVIVNKKDKTTVKTTEAIYDSKKGDFVLLNRSIVDEDKRHIEADVINYEKETLRSEGRGNVVYLDRENDRELYGDHVVYYEKAGESKAVGNAILKDNKRNAELHGDSLLVNKEDSLYRGFGHVVFTDHKNKNELHGNYFWYKERFNHDLDYGFVTDNAWGMDYSQEDTLYMRADTMEIFTYHVNEMLNLKDSLNHTDSLDNSGNTKNLSASKTTKNTKKSRDSKNSKNDEAQEDSVYREVHCNWNVRAYRKDFQAVCDSMIGCSVDSSLTLYPVKDSVAVAWSENRQISGKKIVVFMNDSTIRQAHVVGEAFSIEKCKNDEENHYNQISCDSLTSNFIDGKVRENFADGNVRVLFYPVDEKTDSLMFLNFTETSQLRMFLSPEQKMQKIWTAEHTSVLYPLTQIPPDKYRLDRFKLRDYLRPKNKEEIMYYQQRKPSADTQAESMPAEDAEKASVRKEEEGMKNE